MNNSRKSTNLILFTIISVCVIIAMVFAIGNLFNSNVQESANAAVLVSSFESQDGYMYNGNTIISEATEGYELGSDGRYHMTTDYIDDNFSSATKISTATELKEFINSPTSSSAHGILVADIEYDMPTLRIVASGASFAGTLDGNAYTISMTPQVGGSVVGNSYKAASSSLFGEATAYHYTGMLMAINSGTIKNLNINWLRNNAGALNVNAALTSSNGTLKNVDGYSDSTKNPIVAGIICGLNNGGTIQNCNLTIEGAFAMGQIACDSNTQLRYNTCIAGGICGALYNGTITRCTLNNNGGVLALADGSRSGGVNKTAGAMAGGITGVIRSSTTAKITNCSLTGTGTVTAMCGHNVSNRNNDGCWGQSGGITAGDVYTQNQALAARALQDGQIDGIISAWTGPKSHIWKTNGNVEIKNIYGCLIYTLGGGELTALKNVVILYDYIGNLQSYGSSHVALDSEGLILYGNWVEVYAKNSGGNIEVSYDYTKLGNSDNKIIRVEAVANGYIPEGIDTATADEVKYEFTTGDIGNFIWTLETCQTYGGTKAQKIETKENIAAHLYHISASTVDSFSSLIYTFGEKATLSYKNLNTQGDTSNFISDNSKSYDGELFKLPQIMVKRGNLDGDYINISSSAYQTVVTYTVLDGTENATTYTVSDLTKLYLPGAYTVTSVKNVGGKNYQYYDETSYVLVDYDEANKYDYSIVAGKASLLNIACNSDSVTWLQEDTIIFNYANKANTFDYYTYAKGNEAASSLQVMPVDEVNAEININESGKYYYTIATYIENPYYAIVTNPNPNTQYIKIATNSIQVFIDTLAPEFMNVKYYVYDASKDDHKGAPISTLELEDWQYDDVLVEYQVRDANLSGIESGNGHISYTIVNDSRWDCYVRLTGNNPSQTVTYQDAAGNSAATTFSALIDTTQLELNNVKALNRGEYLSYYAQLGYCPTTVKILFTPVFGASGAHMYYSYEQDTNGNDIWVKYDATLKANQPNTFIINFELNNKPFKMKLVSDENMYADAFANGDGFVRNGAENEEEAKLWNVKIIIAGIGITLDNLYYGSQSLSSMSEAELNALFNKTYNASEISEVVLTAKVYSTGTELIANTILIYSDQYLYTTPAVEESYLKVVASFASKNAGTWDVTLRVDSVDEYYNKYLVRFLTGSTTANLNELTTDTSKYLISKKVATSTIDKAIMEINLANYPEQLSSSYVYGDNIPSQITVEGEGEIITLNLITDAKITKDDDDMLVYPNVGDYPVNAELAGEIANYDLSIIPTNITILKKGVTVTPRLDGNVDFNTTITFDGIEHAITGTYKDVFNETKDAAIKYYSEKECINEIEVTESGNVLDVNVYFAKITIDNSNYEVTNNGNPIKFTITKGYLDLDLESQTKSFAGQNLSFEIKTKTAVNPSYYEDGTFTINYYKVTDNVADFSKTVNPFEVGRYLVQITFAGSENFYDKPYDDTYLTINKAATVTSANDIRVVYDEQAHKFALIDTDIKVSANGGNTTVIKVENEALKYYAYNGSQAVEGDASEAIEVRFVDPDTLTPMLIDDSTAPEFINAGSYEFRIMFKGDDCFASSSTRINFIVDKAQFEGLEFNDAKYNFIDKNSENYHSIFVEGSTLDAYIEKGAVITYTYLGDNYVDKGEKGLDINNGTKWTYQSGVELDSNPLSFNNVGEYTIIAIVSLENYDNLELTATLEIDKTAMPNVLPKEVTRTYTGTFVTGEFEIENHTMHPVYYAGYESSKYMEFFTMDDDDERIYVYYDSNSAPVNVGNYVGTITLKSTTYADTPVKVKITIEAAKIETVSFDSIEDIYEELDSNTDLSILYPTFIFGGEEYAAEYEYYDLDDNKVELSSDGTLAPGEYIVKVKFSDGNYSTEQYATIEVSEVKESGNKDGSGNKPGSSGIMDLFNQYKLPIIIGGAVLVVAIVGIVLGVTLSKKKKAKARKKRKPTKPSGSGSARKAPPTPEKKSQAPVKRERREGPQDKAQF
ncbi:MAG: hypothetical protein E7338_02460 [Clostridiales bacterium]|nr:hypothetical protein [Clostridiales bacterium]